MVHSGKPSTGCQNCRIRRIKCDETRPYCRACVKTGRSCPGYRHPFDVMLRDQVAFTRKKSSPSSRIEKGKSVSPKSKKPSPSLEEEEVALSAAVVVSTARPQQQLAPFLSKIIRPANPRGLSLPLEDTVTSLFFNSYLCLPRDAQFNNGFMELLPASYSHTAFGSHLHLSTLAVSFFSVAAWTGQRALLQTSEQFFVRALPRIRQALQGDVDNNLDEILMTVLLLSTYEELSYLKDWKTPPRAHLRGAVALMNSRHPENSKSPLSKVMAYAVQTQIIKTSQGLAYPTVQTPDVWPLLPPVAPTTAPSQLSMATSDLVNLRLAWEKVTAASQASREDIMAIISQARSLDTKLLAWVHSVPAHWIPLPAFRIPQSVNEAGLFQNRCDCYADMWVASTWNSYRDSRIVVQNIVLGCFRLLSNDQSAHDAHAQSAASIIQTLATDICATVPFFIGSQMSSIQGNPQTVEYPEAEGRSMSTAHRQIAPLLGGWFVLSYLGNLCSPGLRHCLGEEQLTWIMGQIQRILGIYTFGFQAAGRLPIS